MSIGTGMGPGGEAHAPSRAKGLDSGREGAEGRFDHGVARLRPRLRQLGLIAPMAMALVTGGALAEDESRQVLEPSVSEIGAEAPEEERHKGLEVIVVSAERRERDLQHVPASVSSFGSGELLDKGLTNFNTLQYNVPSLFSGGGLTKITLRGVGSEIVGPGIDPGFAVHVNSVFSARETTGLLDYYDIERVDVLRGPQGTLWGRNSTGGAVNIVTRKAEHDFDAGGDFEFANFQGGANGVRVRGMLNMPLVEDEVALRVALLTHVNDGLMKMKGGTHEQRVSDAGITTLRASFRWDASDDVRVDVIGSWLRSKGAGPGQKFDGPYYTPPQFPDSLSARRNAWQDWKIASWPGAGPGGNFVDDPNFGPALPNPESAYEGTADEPQRLESTVWTATILVGWETDLFELESITGYQSTDFFLHRDADTSSLPIAILDLTDKSRQISQEFLINSTWDRSFDYTVGTNYQYDWTPQTRLRTTNAQNTLDSVNWQLLPSLHRFISPGGFSLVDGCPPPSVPTSFPPGCPPVKALGTQEEDVIDALTEARNHVYGLFGNLTWRPIEDWSLSAGGRFSYTYRRWNDQTNSVTYSAFTRGAPRDPAARLLLLDQPTGIQIKQLGLRQENSWTSGTWKGSTDYKLTDDHMVWASVGTGSRAGGFNFSEEQHFQAEFILAVEGGVKTMFFDNRLMANVTGFWYDWDDPQIGTTESALPITRNAPSARSYGVELDFRALPVDELVLNGSFGWLEANYDEDFVTPDNTLQDYEEVDVAKRAKEVNVNGARLPRSPRFTASFGAQYTFDLGRWGLLVPRADFYFRDEIQFRQHGNPEDVAGAYTRTDARITWRSGSDQFWAEIFARNLENNAVKTNQETNSTIYRVHYYDAPINGGVRFGYNFR